MERYWHQLSQVTARIDLRTMPTYHPDDIIRLAIANPGYGFREFLEELYPTRGKKSKGRTGEGVTLRLFKIYKHESGVDLFEVLQDTSNHKLVNLVDYMKKTGEKYPPRGYGTQTRESKLTRKNQRGSNIKIPLPPQEFNWLDVEAIPDEERIAKVGFVLAQSHFELMDYEKLIKLTKDINEYQPYHRRKKMDVISVEMGASKKRIEDFLLKMEKYEEEGIGEEWIEVMKNLWKYQCIRGKTHKEDELMMEFRTIFQDYMNDPVNIEPPTGEDMKWVYQQLLAEENENDDLFYPPEIDLEVIKQETIQRAAEIKFEKQFFNRRAGTFYKDLDQQIQKIKFQRWQIENGEFTSGYEESLNDLQQFYLFAKREYDRLSEFDLDKVRVGVLRDEMHKASQTFTQIKDLHTNKYERTFLTGAFLRHMQELYEIQQVIIPYLSNLDNNSK